MADSSRLRGWKYDHHNNYMEVWVNGTAVARFDDATNDLRLLTNGMTIDAGGLTITAGGLTVTGTITYETATTVNAELTVGANAAGYRVTFYGDTSGASLIWSDTENKLYFIGAANLHSVGSGSFNWAGTGGVNVGNALTVTGTANIQGAVGINNSLTVTGNCSFQGATVGINNSITIGANCVVGGNIELTGTMRGVGVATFDDVVNVDDTTASTGVDSGALIVDGGLGVAGRGNFGGKVIITAGNQTSAMNNLYSVVNAAGDTGWTGSVAATRSRVYLNLTAGTIGNSYGGWFGLEFGTSFVATGAGLTCGIYAEASNNYAGSAPSAVAYFQSVVATNGVNTGMPILVLTSTGGSNADKSKYAIEFGHQPAATTVSTGSGGMYHNETIMVKVNTADRFIPLSTVEGTYTSAYPVALTYGGTALDIASTITTADIIQTITVTDSGTQSTGRGIGLFVDYVASNNKTGDYGVRSSRINTQILGNVDSVIVGDWYMHTIDDKTIGWLMGMSMYWEDYGNAVAALAMIDLGINSPHAITGTDRHTFIRCREHDTVQAISSILTLEGNNAAAFLLDFHAQADSGESCLVTDTDNANVSYGIKVRLHAHGDAVKYIHLHDA